MKSNRKVRISLYLTPSGEFLVKARCADIKVWRIDVIEAPEWYPNDVVWLTNKSPEALRDKKIKRTSWLYLLLMLNVSQKQLHDLVKSKYRGESELYSKKVRIREI